MIFGREQKFKYQADSYELQCTQSVLSPLGIYVPFLRKRFSSGDLQGPAGEGIAVVVKHRCF